jgi:hypothetical protein
VGVDVDLVIDDRRGRERHHVSLTLGRNRASQPIGPAAGNLGKCRGIQRSVVDAELGDAAAARTLIAIRGATQAALREG